MTTANNLAHFPSSPIVNCLRCEALMFDGETLVSRCIKIRPDGHVVAKCKHCKTFNQVPLRLAP